MYLPRWTWMLLALTLLSCVRASAQEAKGVLIRLNPAGKLEVAEVNFRDTERMPPAAGLLIWPINDHEERWAFLSPKWKAPAITANLAGAPASLRFATRGAGEAISGADLGLFTVQLEQLSPDTSTRNAGVYPLTPVADGRLLNPRPTFRRLPLDKEPRFPAAVALLVSNQLAKPLLLPFAAGKDRVNWDDIPKLPAEATNGLPAGRYVLGPQKGLDGKFVTFHVEERKDRDEICRPLESMDTLLPLTSPVRIQFHFEHLVRFRGEHDAPLYLSDAFDLLESVPEKNLTPYLRKQRAHLLRLLQAEPCKRSEALAPATPPGDATGIPELEIVRKWIAAGRWREAVTALEAPALQKKAETDGRTAGLVQLYRGVVLAESGPTRETEAYAAFTAAFRKLESPADRFRAHVNCANFLQRSATDRLHNHALQMAAGVSRPFLSMMHDWIEANANYEAALPLADQLKAPGQKAAVQVNQARLHALLADLIRTLEDPEQRAFPEGEKAASAASAEFAKAAADAPDAEDSVRAITEEVRAMLAFRARDDMEAGLRTHRALALHLDSGNLAGVENAYRMLGLIAERSSDKQARKEALKQFQVAQMISESLRERFPPESAGLTRAGFFARKAYASDKLVELLLAEGRAGEALHFLELSRARSLQDLLAARNVAVESRTPSLADMLAKWPGDVAAVEYFLGTDRAYVFVIAPDGMVSAHLLRDAKGQPIAPRELITGVRRLLWDMEKQATKMYNRIVARQGFDHAWQDDLHRLYHELLPASARQQLAGAKVVVVVPQHILHYFPFAALVVEPDRKANKKQMAHARFLVDEPFDLVYAPSLLSWRRLPAASARQVWAVGVAEAPGAPALDGVKKDLANLQAIFGPQVKGVLDGDQARVADVQKLLKERGLLFFGTHGMNVADRPLESHLMLMPDEGAKDGHLTAAHLFGRRINADVVIMSACYSGLGDRSPLPGDDLFGLQRAFLQSGVRTVVSGLWDVYDGTAPELMQGFFTKLKDGKTVPASLAGSQRGFLKRLRTSGQEEPWLHPYFWAVYTAAGDDRTRFEK